MDRYLFDLISRRRQLGTRQEGGQADLLDLLIQSGMEDQWIRDQILTMLIAGHDTSTALLSWTWYLLGTHPEALQRAQAEVRATDPAVRLGNEIIGSLPYLDRILTETLRLYPPIHLGSRITARELIFKQHRIPAGSRVIYSIYLTQRHPEFWQAPDQFDPDRHLPGRRALPYAWLAFGGGPRNCIGAAFGRFESMLVMASVLDRYDVSQVEQKVHPHMGATLEPRPGVRMRVRES